MYAAYVVYCRIYDMYVITLLTGGQSKQDQKCLLMVKILEYTSYRFLYRWWVLVTMAPRNIIYCSSNKALITALLIVRGRSSLCLFRVFLFPFAECLPRFGEKWSK